MLILDLTHLRKARRQGERCRVTSEDAGDHWIDERRRGFGSNPARGEVEDRLVLVGSCGGERLGYDPQLAPHRQERSRYEFADRRRHLMQATAAKNVSSPCRVIAA